MSTQGGRGAQFEEGNKVEYEALPDDEEGCYANFAYDAGDNFDGFGESSGDELEEAEVEVTGTVDDAPGKDTAAEETGFGGFDDEPPAPAPAPADEAPAPAPRPSRKPEPAPPKVPGRSSVMSLEGAGSMKKETGTEETIPGLNKGDVAHQDGSSVTMWDRNPSKMDKTKLLLGAMKGLKIRPSAAPLTEEVEPQGSVKGSRKGSMNRPTGLRQPSIKKKKPKQLSRKAEPSPPEPAPRAAAKKSTPPPQQAKQSPPKSRPPQQQAPAVPKVDLPPRQSYPDPNPNFKCQNYEEYGWDFCILYKTGVDDDAAERVAQAIDDKVFKSTGGCNTVFFDRWSIKSLYLEARGTWRKKAATEKVNGLLASKAYVLLLSPESLAEMRDAHAKENPLLWEMEYVTYSTKTVLPIYIGSDGRLPSFPDPAQFQNLTPFHPWANMRVRKIIETINEYESYKFPNRLESGDEMNELIEALTSISCNEGVPAQSPQHQLETSNWEVSGAKSGGGQAAAPSKSKPAAPAAVSYAADPHDDDANDDVETMDWAHWQLPRGNVDVGKRIGAGEFGDVCTGIMHGHGDNVGMKAMVAIKTMKEAHKDKKREFLDEAMTMVNLHHRNLVNIYGVCTLDEPILIVSELCEHGSLKDYLPTAAAQSHTYEDLFTMIEEIAEGMEHVEDVGFVHRDLAARNVLVEQRSSGVRCKVADFGLAKELKASDRDKDGVNAVWQGDVKRPVPIRWTAPEAIRYARFSILSDVWSYGITCYEILTFGDDPYENATNQEVVNMVCDEGVRLPIPPPDRALRGCPKELHDFLLLCWKDKRRQRPTFKQIVNELLPQISPFDEEDD